MDIKFLFYTFLYIIVFIFIIHFGNKKSVLIKEKKFLFIFLVFLVNSIFSYSSTKTSTDEELQKIFDKNKEIIVVYRNSIKDNIPKKYIENIIPKEEYKNLNDDYIKITIRYTRKNKSNILAEVYTPNGDLAVKTEIHLRKEILFNEIEKLVQEIEDNESSNQSDILNNKFSNKFLENVKSFVSYSYYDDRSVNSKTEYDFDKKNITMLTYGDGKILSKTIAKYKGSIQDENMDIDFYENEYNEDGSLKKETFYKDGIEINKIKFLK